MNEVGADTGEVDFLLGQIEAFCRRTKMAQSTFGRQAVNDGKLINRLQLGGRITLQTMEKIYHFIAAHDGEEAPRLRSAIRGLDISHAAPDFRFYASEISVVQQYYDRKAGHW
jgi:hypothetical protein